MVYDLHVQNYGFANVIARTLFIHLLIGQSKQRQMPISVSQPAIRYHLQYMKSKSRGTILISIAHLYFLFSIDG